MQTVYREKLFSLKQNKTVRNYVRDFDHVSVRIHDMSNYDRMVHFVRGLTPRVRELVRTSSPKNIFEAKERATDLDITEHNHRELEHVHKQNMI